jgi:hypothetical protein
MLARMYWKKVVSKGNRCYKVTKLENFKRSDELPEKYTSNVPMMEPFGDAQLIRFATSKNKPLERIMFREGSLLTEQEKENAIKWMKICGARLTSINKKLAKKNEGWAGEGFDEI